MRNRNRKYAKRRLLEGEGCDNNNNNIMEFYTHVYYIGCVSCREYIYTAFVERIKRMKNYELLLLFEYRIIYRILEWRSLNK